MKKKAKTTPTKPCKCKRFFAHQVVHMDIEIGQRYENAHEKDSLIVRVLEIEDDGSVKVFIEFSKNKYYDKKEHRFGLNHFLKSMKVVVQNSIKYF